MSSASEEGDSALGGKGGFRERSRIAREGVWFALLISGLVVMIAVLFYDRSLFDTTTQRCQSLGSVISCSSGVASRGIFGSGLGAPPFASGNASPWVTTYWVVSIFLASCAVVAFYWLRSRTVNKRSPIWPFATLFIEGVVLIAVGRGFVFNDLPGDMIVRGMQALLLVALGLVTIAIIARSWTLSIFVAGFFGLALMSCLYDVSNLFHRIGIGASKAPGESLPNLMFPAIYLIVGAGTFLVLNRFMTDRGETTQS